MQFRIFQYPLPCETEPLDLNRFLANHRVASVNQYVMTEGGVPMVVFVVQTAMGTGETLAKTKERIDYRATMTPEQFTLFDRLRDERKRLADRDGIPVYSVFNNSHLATMVERPILTIAELSTLAGVGDGKIDKYGESLLRILQANTAKA